MVFFLNNMSGIYLHLTFQIMIDYEFKEFFIRILQGAVMNGLDYQPLFGNMSPRSFPSEESTRESGGNRGYD